MARQGRAGAVVGAGQRDRGRRIAVASTAGAVMSSVVVITFGELFGLTRAARR